MFGLLLHTKITMLSSSLAGTKVTAATRVQTVKRNTTVRAATEKMGAKGKKRGGKVRVALSFYFPTRWKIVLPKSLFRFEGGALSRPAICLDKRERERDSTLASFLSVSAKAPQSLDSLLRGARTVVKNRFIGGTLFVRAVSLVERGRKKRVCVCFPGLSLFSKEAPPPPFFVFFFS